MWSPVASHCLIWINWTRVRNIKILLYIVGMTVTISTTHFMHRSSNQFRQITIPMWTLFKYVQLYSNSTYQVQYAFLDSQLK